VVPLGARLISTGSVGYIPPPHTVTGPDPDEEEALLIAFGRVKNVAPSDEATTVVMELIWTTDANFVNLGEVDFVGATVGNVEVDNINFYVVNKVSCERIVLVTAKSTCRRGQGVN